MEAIRGKTLAEISNAEPNVFYRGSRYEVLETLQSGPGQSLLRVFDRLRGEELALRAVPSRGLSERNLADFRSEFLKLSGVDHPGLARPVDFGRSESAVFYTRELAPGKPITEAPFAGNEQALVECLTGIVDALAALHEAGQIHGLVLPGHLPTVLAEGRLGSTRVADAGLRHLLPGDYLASHRRYEAPEVKAGADVSPASDLYQLGATLLEALGGPEALSHLGEGRPRPFRSQVRGLDRQLLDLLDLLVAPDPRRRPASGLEVLRVLRAPGWILPARPPAVDLFISPLLVGRERALGELGLLLREAAKGEAHAGEIVGAAGMGRSRLLAEAGARGASEGWVVVPVDPPTGEDPLEELAAQVELALEVSDTEHAAREHVPVCPPEMRERASFLIDDHGAETVRHARFAATVCSAVDRADSRLLFLVDNADRLPADLLGALRYLVTETGGRRILILSTALQPAGLPEATVVEIGPLGERDLRRLLGPFLTEAVNPEPAFAALERASGGSPLWVRLLLASWLDSGRLRLTEGRPYFDEDVPAEIPPTIGEAVRALVATLNPPERDVVEALAVWGRPLSAGIAAKFVPDPASAPRTLLITDESGMLRFASDTFGPLILEALPADRRRVWHARILDALEGEEVDPGLRAFHLLGSGRPAEAVRDLVAGARRATSVMALHTALGYYRLAFPNLGALDPGEVDGREITLEAARVAIRIGEFKLAGEMLERIEVPTGRSDAEVRLHLELLLARAHVLRERRFAEEAAEVYAEARAFAQSVKTLRAELVRIDLEEAANDAKAGRWQVGLERLGPVLEQLTAEGKTELLPIVLNRMATLRGRSGDTRVAASLLLRAARIARRHGDHLVAARAFTNLGTYYLRLARPVWALRALDRCDKHLAACPHDGLAASALLHRGNVLMGLGRSVEAEKALLHARMIHLRSGNRAGLPAVLIELGELQKRSGRLEEAEAVCSGAVAIAEEFELADVYTARANLGELLLAQGELREAERLMRSGLSDPQPARRALGLRNLGSLLRARGRMQEALQVLEECEMELTRFLPDQRPLAVIEAARVHLDMGEANAAELRLDLAQEAAESADAFQRMEYFLARGLLLVQQHEDAYVAFDRAIMAAEESRDPTLLAKVIIDALKAILKLENPDQAWIRSRIAILEEAASSTDARPVAAGLEAVRGQVANRFPPATPVRQLAEDFASNVLARAEGSVDLLLRHLVGELEGARGAVVIAVGIGPEGALSLSSVPQAPKTELGVVRPYRVAAREFDRQIFRQALEAAEGNVPRAAQLLRLPVSTFRYRAGKLGLLRPEKRGSSS